MTLWVDCSLDGSVETGGHMLGRGRSESLRWHQMKSFIPSLAKYPRTSMPMAFVLINADLGAEEELLKSLRGLEFVKDVYVVYGVYDIIARVEADTMEKVKETITWKIRRLDRVRSTLTMIVVEG